MKSTLVALSFIVCGVALAESPQKDPSFEILLPSSLESERPPIKAAFQNAEIRIATFAQKYGWSELTIKPFIKKARIFDSKPNFDNTIVEFLGYPNDTKLPATFCAALEKEVFFSVSPSLYKEIYDDGREAAAFEKLITHEIAHRLHIRILNGNEEAMGPVWFYEGFAIYAADQFEVSLPTLKEEEIWSIVESPNRGSYKKYAAIMRFFLEKTTLKDLLSRASEPNFIEWLRSLK
ncbi:MAG: hypothetical protein IPM97_14435 [Bdellovibrionaceae bacterium]|nr:hypothetical protein [Pseudobdellovibrionaceae bacterium]